ncbi:CHAT domain-containing protein [Actinoallomurus purpureus]|uniref:CHAT domain-containing protein n=1 Tax=Actinoallomurus purpureus TaxID=478114 RepID=UPI002093613E|nr:CHAT domain-containing protein [Actinoallomurus purpureus]MCO6009795.1 CHAT domain-containing protein [Actinoallomurus purpureus]
MRWWRSSRRRPAESSAAELEALRSRVSATRSPAAWAALEVARAQAMLRSPAAGAESGLLKVLDILSGARSVAMIGDDRTVVGTTHATAAEVYDLLDRNADDLDRRVGELTMAAHWLRHGDPAEYIRCLNVLGDAYRRRVHDLHWRNMEKALSVLRAATRRARRLERWDLWARAKLGLGVAYGERIAGDRRRNHRRALHAFDDAIAGFSRLGDAERWAQAHSALAEAHLKAEELSSADLRAAVAACRSALTVYSRDRTPFEWAVARAMLGKALMLSCEPHDPDFDRALRTQQDALQIFTGGTTRDERSAAAATLIGLAEGHVRKVAAGFTAEAAHAVECLSRALKINTELGRPFECRAVAVELGMVHADIGGDWNSATSAWEAALEAHEVLLSLSPDQQTREMEASEGQRLVGLLAYAHARAGNPEAAGVALERGRARVARNFVESDLLSPDLTPEMYAAAIAAEPVAGPWPASEFSNLVARLRTVFPDFLRPADAQTLLSAVASGQAVSYLAVTVLGSVWIVLSHAEDRTLADAIIVDDVTSEDLRQLLTGGYVQAQFWAPADFPRALADGMRRLETLLAPLRRRIDELGPGSLILIPTGYTNLLPLHLGLEAEGRTVSYAPSMTVLTMARTNATVSRNGPASLVAVAVADSTPPLPLADVEVRRAAALFENVTVFSTTPADGDEVLAAAEHADYLHFASHGHANANQPQASYLELPGGGRLHVADIIRRPNELRGTRVAVLSACQTALTLDQPDELLALPTAFLVAGVAGVIAALWAVDDLATALLMDRLYVHLTTGGLSPARALRRAQRDLATMTAPDVLTYLREREVPENVTTTRSGAGAPEPDARGFSPYPFADPYYWAGFLYIGA